MDQDRIRTTRELLARIRASREQLDGLVSVLSAPELTEPGADGRSVKDHLAHLAAWELSLVALLEGRDRHAAMGLPATSTDPCADDLESINARILERGREQPLAQVLAEYRDAHVRLIAAVERLADADLARPYSSYQPDSDDARPVLGWIAGDTYKHYAEHLTWITAILDQVGPTI